MTEQILAVQKMQDYIEAHQEEDLRLGQILENGCDRLHRTADDVQMMGALRAVSLLDVLDLIGITVCLSLGLIPFTLRIRFLGAKLV